MVFAPAPIALFFDVHEPNVDLVDLANVLAQNLFVGVDNDVRFAVPLPQVGDDVVELIDLRVHDSQVTNQSDLFKVEGTTIWGLLPRCKHSA